MSQALFKNIILLVSVALLVAAPVLYFNMLRPTIDNAQQLNGQLESEKEVLKNIQNIADGLNEQIQKITVSGGDKKLEQVIPNGSQISTLLNEIYAMGAQSNVVVTGIIPILKVNTPQPDAEKNIFLKQLNQLLLNIKISGNYQGIKNFAGLIENEIRFTDIQTITLKPSKKSNEDQYDVEVKASTYYY